MGGWVVGLWWVGATGPRPPPRDGVHYGFIIFFGPAEVGPGKNLFSRGFGLFWVGLGWVSWLTPPPRKLRVGWFRKKWVDGFWPGKTVPPPPRVIK